MTTHKIKTLVRVIMALAIVGVIILLTVSLLAPINESITIPAAQPTYDRVNNGPKMYDNDTRGIYEL